MRLKITNYLRLFVLVFAVAFTGTVADGWAKSEKLQPNTIPATAIRKSQSIADSSAPHISSAGDTHTSESSLDFKVVDFLKAPTRAASEANSLENATKASFSVFDPYLADLQRRIRRQWFPPKGSGKERIQLIFRVHRDGSITNLRIVTPSGSSIANHAALNAVKDASPFSPLPAWAADELDIDYTFDYSQSASGRARVRSF